jgi:presenilin-like A22 family membrane protease
VLIGTVIILLIIQFKQHNLWKVWYFFAVLLSLIVALNPFIYNTMSSLGISGIFPTFIAVFVVSVLLSGLKVFMSNIYIHNITEILMYGGLAALLVPVLNLFSVAALLVFISAYDAYAVWKSKHMVKMAEFQKSSNLFAGFSFPYKASKASASSPKASVSVSSKAKSRASEEPANNAILGGGDVAFPLLFAGVVMKTTGSYLYPLVVVIVTSGALFALFARAEKGKFYPAMPFLSLGCFLGLFACWIIGLM